MAAIAAVGLMTPAGASGAIVKRSDSTRMDKPLEIGTATAKCPGGSVAAGGGFKLSPNSVSANRTSIVYESQKAG